jgi:hypothetical protein
MSFFTEIEKPIFKFIWKHKIFLIVKKSWPKKAVLEIPQLLTSNYTTESLEQKQHATGTKTNMFLRKRMEDPEISSPCCSHLTFDKGIKIVQWRKDQPNSVEKTVED